MSIKKLLVLPLISAHICSAAFAADPQALQDSANQPMPEMQSSTASHQQSAVDHTTMVQGFQPAPAPSPMPAPTNVVVVAGGVPMPPPPAAVAMANAAAVAAAQPVPIQAAPMPPPPLGPAIPGSPPVQPPPGPPGGPPPPPPGFIPPPPPPGGGSGIVPPSGGSGQPEKILFAQIPSYKVDALEDMYDTLSGLAAAARSLPDTLPSVGSVPPNPSAWQSFMKINELMPVIEAQEQIFSILQDGRSYTKDELTDSEVAQLQVNLRYNRLAHPGPYPGLAPPDFNLDLDILELEARIQNYESDNMPGKRPKDVLQRQLDYYRSLRTIRDEPDIAKARFLINEHNLKEMWRYNAAHNAAYKRVKAAHTALMAAMAKGNWAAAVTEFRHAVGNLAFATDELLRKNRTVAAHGLL